MWQEGSTEAGQNAAKAAGDQILGFNDDTGIGLEIEVSMADDDSSQEVGQRVRGGSHRQLVQGAGTCGSGSQDGHRENSRCV